jgi:hypothetical protein
MEIGQHFLEGSVVELKQPFMMMDKVGDGTSDLEVKGIIKKKIIFKNRPKPLGLKRVRP